MISKLQCVVCFILMCFTGGCESAFHRISADPIGWPGGQSPVEGYDQFGASIDTMGDLDGDTVMDLVVVSSWDDDDAETGKYGSLTVLFMNEDATVKAFEKTDYDTLQTCCGLVLQHTGSFGSSVASADFNGDLVMDVIVGAQNYDDGGLFNAGALYMLFMKSDGSGMVDSGRIIKATGSELEGGIIGGTYFGSDVAVLGDLDADSGLELAIGSRAYGLHEGSVHILFLESDGSGDIRTGDGSQLIIKTGEHGKADDLVLNDSFGECVVRLDDMDNDGIPELAVGAKNHEDKGGIWILFLATDGSVKTEQKISTTAGNFGFPREDIWFGVSVTNVGDLDSNGVNDIFVGAYDNTIYLFLLQPNGTILEEYMFTNGLGGLDDTAIPAGDGGFGTDLFAVDLNKDGLAELLVAGERSKDYGLTAAGAFYIMPLTEFFFFDTCAGFCSGEYDNCTYSVAGGTSGLRNTSAIIDSMVCNNTCNVASLCSHPSICTPTSLNDYECVNLCSPDPCRNDGNCTFDDIYDYACACATGFTGKNCTVDVDDCMGGPCSRNGNCSDDGSVPNSFNCTCNLGYTGDVCAEDVDDCASGPCFNGTCFDDALLPNTFSCNCTSGYTGDVCNSEIDECTTEACVGDRFSSCVDLLDGFTCICEAGYTGDDCDIDIDDCLSNPCAPSSYACMDLLNDYQCLNKCDSSPCENGGVCMVNTTDNSKSVCNCSQSWSGTNCTVAVAVDDCANPNSNCSILGTSICVDTGLNSYDCLCNPGYSGVFCEEEPISCPCINNGTCGTSQNALNGTSCICTGPWVGDICDIVLYKGDVLTVVFTVMQPRENETLDDVADKLVLQMIHDNPGSDAAQYNVSFVFAEEGTYLVNVRVSSSGTVNATDIIAVIKSTADSNGWIVASNDEPLIVDDFEDNGNEDPMSVIRALVMGLIVLIILAVGTLCFIRQKRKSKGIVSYTMPT